MAYLMTYKTSKQRRVMTRFAKIHKMVNPPLLGALKHI